MRYIKSTLFVLLIMLLLPYFVTPEENFVYNYGEDNFKQQIEDMDGNFVMFYAPWCRHCTEFYPIWNELAQLVNTKDSSFGIAQVDCTIHSKLCQDNDITGYPSLLYFYKNNFVPVDYKGTRDLASLTMFLSEVLVIKYKNTDPSKESSEVKMYSGVAYLTDHNIEKFISKGQHFIMFYAPWCKASQRIAPAWTELATHYALNQYIQIGKVNCLQNEATCKSFDIKQYPYLVWIVNGRITGESDAENLTELKQYVETMLLTENHDPDKFMKQKKSLPVARISEETFETFMQKELVFVNYFAPWCAHCMQLNPLWVQLGEHYQNDSSVLIADVDCVRSKHICETEKISSLPTLVLYKNQKVVLVERGAQPLEDLLALVAQHRVTATVTDNTQQKDEL